MPNELCVEANPPHCWICDVDMAYLGQHKWYDGTLRDTWRCESCGNVKSKIVNTDVVDKATAEPGTCFKQ